MNVLRKIVHQVGFIYKIIQTRMVNRMWVKLFSFLFLAPPELQFHSYYVGCDRLCGLVVRVSGYRYRGLGLDSRRYQIF